MLFVQLAMGSYVTATDAWMLVGCATHTQIVATRLTSSTVVRSHLN